MSLKDEVNKEVFILFADIAGYTALMQKNEADAAKLLQKFRVQLQKIVPAQHTFLFIQKNRSLINQQAFHPPDSVVAHPRYQELMQRRGFSLIKRSFKQQ